jgi:[ribosomal protein S5]-alanine N-acetyltransferase
MILNEPIAGPSLTLRSLSNCDIGRTYVDWLNDSEVNCFLETRHIKQDLETIREFVQNMNQSGDQLLLGIFVEDDRHIGNIKIGPINSVHRFADISLFIGDKASWGHGYGKQAVTLLSKYGFERLGLFKICASMYEENVASRRLFLTVGFREEGFFRDHCINAQGRRTGIHCLALFELEFLARSSERTRFSEP